MEMNTYREERRYSVPQGPHVQQQLPPASEDLHAWSIYRYALIRKLHKTFKNFLAFD